MHELLLSLVTRSSSKCTVPVCRPGCPQVVERDPVERQWCVSPFLWLCYGSSRRFCWLFEVALFRIHSAVLWLWVMQRLFCFSFVCPGHTTDRQAPVHIVSLCFTLTCSNEHFFKNSYRATAAVSSEGWGALLGGYLRFCRCRLPCVYFEAALKKSSTTFKPKNFWFKTTVPLEE